MFHWALEVQTHVKTSPKKVWEAWSDVSSWSKWDISTKKSHLNGDFATGAVGKKWTKGWFSSAFSIHSAEQGKRFTTKMRIIGAKVQVHHFVAPWWEEKVRIVHRVEASGFFSPLLWLIVGRKWKKELSESMKNLSEFIEHS